MLPNPTRLVLRALLTFSIVSCLGAQCALQWLPGDPVSMPRGSVRATVLWDPDGAGPLPVHLVVAGFFVVGTATCQVAMYDGSVWSPVGAATGETVTAMAIHNDSLVIAGAGNVRRLVGTTWQRIGTYSVGVNSATVYAMVVFNGDLVIGGGFTTVAGSPANCIARWNGTSWSALGTGAGGAVYALAVYAHQNQAALYVGGSFTSAGGVPTDHLAIWTGSAWVATAGVNGNVYALAVRTSMSITSSYLFVGGSFTTAGGIAATNVARYQSFANTWSAVGSFGASGGLCYKLYVRDTTLSYELVASDYIQVSRWTGSAWSTVGPNLAVVQGLTPNTGNAPTIQSLTYWNGRYTVGLSDYYSLLGGVYSWDGSAWQSTDGDGIDRQVQAVLPVGDEVVIGGAFRSISGVVTNGIAIGQANAWRALGAGVTNGVGSVLALARMPNGDIVAGGSFSVASGGVADGVARWDGSSWQPLGTGTNGWVEALAVLPNGELVAAGSFSLAAGVLVDNIAKWNGTTWSWLGGGTFGSPSGVRALHVLGNGDLVVVGSFTRVGNVALAANRVARWSGGVWSAFGTGADATVHAVAAMANGDLLIGGDFRDAGGSGAIRIARWSGSSWTRLPGNGVVDFGRTVRAIVALPGGDIVIGGDRFTNLQSGVGENLVRFHGATSAWEMLRLGRDVLGQTPDVVRGLSLTAAGDVVVVGYFHLVSSVVSANVARLVTTCRADTASYGAGCAGSGGPNLLRATTLPWVGVSFRSRATGMPAQGIVVTLFGATQVSIPLASLLSQGAPGCNLLTTTEILGVALPTAGILDTVVDLPAATSLIGARIHHQVLPCQNFGSGPFLMTASNGLTLTIGSY